jgi:hypothetical protein
LSLESHISEAGLSIQSSEYETRSMRSKLGHLEVYVTELEKELF